MPYDRTWNATEATLTIPLKSRKTWRYRIETDLFHPNVPDEVIDRIFAVMALTPQHTYQVLTKHPKRMAEYFADTWINARIDCEIDQIVDERVDPLARKSDDLRAIAPLLEFDNGKPLPNVWLGTSVERQQEADQRIPHLLQTPAALRFLSCEPLLGPIDLGGFLHDRLDVQAAGLADDPMAAFMLAQAIGDGTGSGPMRPKINWVICGGESGPGARPMHPDWARSLRDQCKEAGTPFFFKQWGDWIAAEPDAQPPFWEFQDGRYIDGHLLPDIECDDRWCEDWATDEFEGHAIFEKVGKKRAGRLLDGVEHNEMPSE